MEHPPSSRYRLHNHHLSHLAHQPRIIRRLSRHHLARRSRRPRLLLPHHRLCPPPPHPRPRPPDTQMVARKIRPLYQRRCVMFPHPTHLLPDLAHDDTRGREYHELVQHHAVWDVDHRHGLLRVQGQARVYRSRRRCEA